MIKEEYWYFWVYNNKNSCVSEKAQIGLGVWKGWNDWDFMVSDKRPYICKLETQIDPLSHSECEGWGIFHLYLI